MTYFVRLDVPQKITAIYMPDAGRARVWRGACAL
jgi:hypothetical protein